MIITNKKYLRGGLISLLIGGFLGTTAIILSLLPFLLSDEPLTGYVLLYLYNASITVFLIVYPIVLWCGGTIAAHDIHKEKNLILVSLKYSAIVNFLSGGSFILTSVLSHKYPSIELDVELPLILMLTFIVISTFTIGLVICFLIKKTIPSIQLNIASHKT